MHWYHIRACKQFGQICQCQTFHLQHCIVKIWMIHYWASKAKTFSMHFWYLPEPRWVNMIFQKLHG